MAEQNTWGFGQVVATGLLVLPLLSFFDAYISGSEKPIEEKEHPHPDPHTNNKPHAKPKRTITTNPWFTKLQILWYLYTFAIGLELIEKIPFAAGVASGSPTSNLTLESGFLTPPAVEAFLEWAALNLALLWLSALLFADESIQAWLCTTALGEWLSENERRFVRYILEAGVVGIWVVGSILFWWWAWYLSIDRIYRFLDPNAGS